MHKGTRHHTEARRHGRVRRLAPFIAAAVAAVATPVVSGIAATGKDQPSRVYAAKANHKLPELRVTAAAAKLNEDGTLTGTATVENAGTARARATTAGVDWKDSATHGEVLLAKFAVPLLKPGQKHKVTWHLKLASKDTAGTYAVQVCADVLSQVHEASKKHLCHSAGSVVFNPKGGVKGFKEEEPPKEAPKETPKEEAPKEAPKETPKETPTGPPDTAIASGPTGAVDSTAATFTFTSNQSPATFQCALDASAWTACSSPQTYNALAEGAHVFQVRAVNSASEVDATPAEAKWTVETEPPIVGLTTLADGSFTNKTTPTFTGTASNGANDSATITLRIYGGLTVGGPLIQTLETTQAAGAWAVPTKPLAEGTYTAQASQSDAAGGMGLSSANTFTIKTTPPVVTLTEPGASSFTNHAKPTFAGAAGTAAGDLPTITVNVYSGSVATGPPVQTLATSASAATWSTTATGSLSDGTYTAQATQSDSAGNTGKSAATTFVVKTTVPPVTLTEPTSGTRAKTGKPSFGGAAGTEAGTSTTVDVNIYSGASATGTPLKTLTTTEAAGAWKLTPTTALANGEYTAQATQADAAGNTGKSTPVTFTVATETPTVTVTAPKAGTETNNTTPTFTGTASTATGDLTGITVNVYSGPSASGVPAETLTTAESAGSWSVGEIAPLLAGEYTVQATQENEAGGVGASNPVTFVVDTTPPSVTLTEPANGAVLNQSKLKFAGAAGKAHGDQKAVTLKIYSGSSPSGTPVQALSAPVTESSWTVTPTTALADGTYTAQATQSDEAGNTGTSSASTFSVQTKAPGPVTSPAVAGNTGTSISLSWTNPTGPDFAGVVVRRAEGTTAPGSPTEGTAIGETSGETHTLTDNTVTTGKTYSYAFFAHNAFHLYATAATLTVTAQESTGGCTDTWTGATNSAWNEAGNWSGGHAPTTSDWACIPAHTANLPVTVNSPQIVAGITNSGELTVNSSLELSDAKNKSTSTGVLTVQGSLEVAHELEVTTLNLNGAINGAGTVVIPSGATLTSQGGEVGVTELINNGGAPIAAERSLNVRQSSKLVNKGTLTVNAGANINGGCGHEATVTEPAIPSGEATSSGKITTNGKTETGSSAVTIGPSGSCLVTHDTGPLNVASGELKLEGATSTSTAAPRSPAARARS